MLQLMPEIDAMLTLMLKLHEPHDPLAFSREKVRSLRTMLYRLSGEFIKKESGSERYHDAYLAYYFPMNFMKAYMVTGWILHRSPQLFNSTPRLRVLDIGCGHGAGMFGVYYALKNTGPPSLVGIDRSTVMLKHCRRIAAGIKQNDSRLRVRLYRQRVKGTFTARTRKKFDMIILANALAEIVREEEVPLRYIEQLFRHLTRDGIIVIIEPASRGLTRRLMKLRDVLLRNKKAHILLPCVHEEPCPLIAVRKGREWCHQSRSWLPPLYMRMLNNTLRREIDRLKFSCLVVSRTKFEESTHAALVISDLLKEKGRQKCYLCTPSGRVVLVRQNKCRSLSNRDFSGIARGDRVILRNVTTRGRTWRIEASSHVTIVPLAV